ncbi:MAG: hypothetical protein JWM76_3702, partial [Pseudonocardiales bacterium]|nr:hypothetical protein [Pseudonocardiales bacterium]
MLDSAPSHAANPHAINVIQRRRSGLVAGSVGPVAASEAVVGRAAGAAGTTVAVAGGTTVAAVTAVT